MLIIAEKMQHIVDKIQTSPIMKTEVLICQF